MRKCCGSGVHDFYEDKRVSDTSPWRIQDVVMKAWNDGNDGNDGLVIAAQERIARELAVTAPWAMAVYTA
jgi:hypothetical protein